MRKGIFALIVVLTALLFVPSVSPAQGTLLNAIQEMNNFSYLKILFVNAMASNGGVVQDAFLTTAVTDSVFIPGMTANGSVMVISNPVAVNTLPVAGDLLNCVVGNGTVGTVGTIYVNRAVNTTSGLKYTIFIERY